MLYAGYGEADITPSVGAPMACFPEGKERRPRRSEGVHLPLRARALAISDGQTTICLCACDVTLWQNADVARIREEAASRVTHQPHILLTATHTHASAENTYLFGGTPNDPWICTLRTRVAEAITVALEGMIPARLMVGQVEAPYNHNRRVIGTDGKAQHFSEYVEGVTEGVTDPTLAVLRYERDDGSTLLWVNWTAHALTLGPGNRLFSADYPGALATYIRSRLPRAQLIFTNGAAGNIHPRWCMRADASALEKLTPLLGEKVLEAMEQVESVDVSHLSLSATTITFPNRADSSLAAEVDISCLRLGSLVVGFLPGEPFVEFQLAFRERLQPRKALLMGYANGWAGYIPTQEAFGQGGYGVDFYPGDPPSCSRTMLPPGAGERLLNELITLVER